MAGRMRTELQALCGHAGGLCDNWQASGYAARVAEVSALSLAIRSSGVAPRDPLWSAFCALDERIRALTSVVDRHRPSCSTRAIEIAIEAVARAIEAAQKALRLS